MTKFKGFWPAIASRSWPFVLIFFIVLLFFYPVFKGYIPFSGDLLVNTNPYSASGFLGFAPGGFPNKAQGTDIVNEIYPWRYFSINELKNLSLPFWNPHNFSGNPQLANFQTAVFYPLNIFYFIFPFNISWTVLIMLQPLLAGIFMYLFLKKGIKLKDFPSFIGGISFAFSSYMAVWMEYGNIGHTLLWLPLILLFTKYFFEKTNIFNFLAITLTLSFAILAGYIQGVFYIYILSFLYYLFLVFSKKGAFKNYKKNILFLTSLIFPIFLTMFQILPTLNLFAQSTRGAYTLSQIENNLAPVFYWITIFSPDFFGNPATRNYWLDGTYIERVIYPGTLIIFFVLFSFFNKINSSDKKFFAVVWITSLIVATNLPFVKYFYLIPIPVISTTVATREFSIFIFSSIVLASIGINYFLDNKNIKKTFPFIYFSALLMFWAGIIISVKLFPDLSANLKISLRNLILPSSLISATLFAFFLKKINKKIVLVIFTLIVVFDLFYFFHKITPFSSQELVYPKTPIISYIKENAGISRHWGYGSAYIPANFQSVDKTYSPEGNDPLHTQRYTELLASSKDGKLPQILPRPDANIAGGYGPDDLKTNFYRKKVLDLLGIKYILHKQELADAWYKNDITTFPQEQFKLAVKIYPWQLYENLDVLPRFFLTPKYIVAENKSKALSLIYSSNVNLKDTIILEESPNIKINPNATGEAKLILYTPNRIEISLNSSDNNLLFISDVYYPEWTAKIDGKKTNILLANYAFRAVAVPSGKHTVKFTYEPKSFMNGLGFAGVGLIVLVFTLFYIKNNEKKI
ncbi:MAG: hypothetical protein COU25_01670 [Candidatus Levybacteria bacterium CG10_big_fil_rev_8_21_14_0_10_35_13]|nr:MAG: hypothetical protein COU25_01670 [Candidatus Levybacteria bacterium CG10_big_fil_rev_8_21_14_0_10_35_13]